MDRAKSYAATRWASYSDCWAGDRAYLGIGAQVRAVVGVPRRREPRTVFYEHTHPPGGLPNYYRENVIGGPGAFVLQIVNFDTFAEAMTNKLLTEVSQHKIQAP